VAEQDEDLEHILVDGASQDDSYQIIDQHRDKLARVISEPDEGIYDAMNKGIQAANGDVIGFLNADDFYPEPGVLRSVKKVFENPETDTCYGDLKYVSKENISKTARFWKAGKFDRRKFYHGWMPPHPTFFARRQVYEKYGGFNLDMGSAADYELMLRLLVKHQLSAEHIPRVLVHMRTGGVSNESFANRLRANRKDREAWRVNDLQPYPWTLVAKPLRKVGQWMIRQ